MNFFPPKNDGNQSGDCLKIIKVSEAKAWTRKNGIDFFSPKIIRKFQKVGDFLK